MVREILIAESDRMVLEEFDRIFKPTSHHLIFASNDEEALLRGKLFKPDLMIGRKELCQAVRSNRELKDIRFIILLDMFEGLSEKECKRLQADGMISRPLNANEIFRAVNPFLEKVQDKEKDRLNVEDNIDWKSFADIGKAEAEKEEELSLDLSYGMEGEEEIIELVDVVEEPESKMSIDDFAILQKADLTGEIVPLEPWEKPEREERGLGKEFLLPPRDKGLEKKEALPQVEEPVTEKKVSPGSELFEKIEMEEILQKMERLQPSIEKEWPVEKEREIPEEIPEEIPKKVAPPPPKAEDRYAGLDEFEAALRGGMTTESEEEALQPLFIDEMKPKPPVFEPPKEETPVELDLQELEEEEFPEIFLEELTEELEKLEERELMSGKAAVEVEEETTEEEEFPELFRAEVQPSEQGLTEAVRVEEPPPVEETTEKEEFPELFGAEVQPSEQGLTEAVRVEEPPPVEETTEEEEFSEYFGAEVQPSEQAFTEAVRAEESPLVEESVPVEESIPMEAMAPVEQIAPEVEIKEEEVTLSQDTAIPKIPPEEIPPPAEEISPPVMRLDRRIEEVISKGVEEMMEDIVTKVLPEMTKHMITTTMERIESLVKEVVFDLAEKVIQEEIRRLKKGEKD